MIRKTSMIDCYTVPSVYVLTEPEEIESVLSRSQRNLVKGARKDLKNGGKIVQVFHPNFLKYSLLGRNTLMYDTVQVMNEHFENNSDFWFILFVLLPTNPTVYVVLRGVDASH